MAHGPRGRWYGTATRAVSPAGSSWQRAHPPMSSVKMVDMWAACGFACVFFLSALCRWARSTLISPLPPIRPLSPPPPCAAGNGAVGGSDAEPHAVEAVIGPAASQQRLLGPLSCRTGEAAGGPHSDAEDEGAVEAEVEGGGSDGMSEASSPQRGQRGQLLWGDGHVRPGPEPGPLWAQADDGPPGPSGQWDGAAPLAPLGGGLVGRDQVSSQAPCCPECLHDGEELAILQAAASGHFKVAAGRRSCCRAWAAVVGPC